MADRPDEQLCLREAAKQPRALVCVRRPAKEPHLEDPARFAELVRAFTAALPVPV